MKELLTTMLKFQALKPNTPDPPGAPLILGGFWVGVMLLIWITGQAKFLPTPWEVVKAFPGLWFIDGLGVQLWTSLTTSIQAVLVMAVLSLGIAYATVMPLFRPMAALISSGRFNGMVGLPLIFMSALHNPHRVKISLLAFGVGVFTVLSLVGMIKTIPKEQFDHSRTLRMGEWRVVWEVVVLGKADEVIDVIRVNAAMVWMMLPGVEGMFRYEGGIGSLMDMESKHFNLDKVFCTMFIILAVGLLQDWVLRVFKSVACPYAELGLERK